MPEQESRPDQPSGEPELSTASLCRNCGTALHGEYCHRCGQRDTEVVRFFPTLLLEAFEGLFAFESKTYRTLWYLFSRPAWLAREYLAGRRVRYLPPTRLFVVFLLAFLFIISIELYLDSLGVDIDQESAETEVTNEEPITTAEDMEELETGVLELIDGLRFPFLSETGNRQFKEFLAERAVNNATAIREDPRDFINQLLEYLPFLLLVMIPLLALMQQLAYLTKKRYYVEHLLLTINNHSFLFLVFILLFLLDLLSWSDLGPLPAITGFLESLLNLWTVIYLFMSLRLFFAQGYLITSFKFVFISILYGVLLIIGALFFSLISFFFY